MLAHLRVGLFRKLASGSRTMFFTGLVQRRGCLMLHLVFLHHRDNCRSRLDSQGTLLRTVAQFRLRMHHVPLLVLTRAIGTVALETVMPSILLLYLVVSITLIMKRLKRIRLS